MKKKFFTSVAILFLAILFTSCSEKIMGYSVVLWNIPEYEIASGDVVEVYIKSNISHVYVVGTKNHEKIEVPLWQITEPVKKSKIKNQIEKYSEYANTYASVKLDGLPAREEAINTAKQVYRLRKGEIIKILYKGNGTAPTTGKNTLSGEWYRILTDNGTEAWCFSYNLTMFQTDSKGNQIGGVKIKTEEIVDTVFEENISKKIWYPDYYKTMISSKSIDLTRLKTSYNFTIDTENKKVSLNLNGIHENWTYDGYTRTSDNEYSLKNIPILIIYKRSDFIVIRYTDDSGKPQELNFITIEQDLNEIIEEEKTRREESFQKILENGPSYSSSNYGKLIFQEDGSFRWTNFKLLVPSIIKSGAKNTGTASVKYTISSSLRNSYDGVLTFKFVGMDSEVNFLYKLENNGLRLEDATGAKFNGTQITTRGFSPLILFFQK